MRSDERLNAVMAMQQMFPRIMAAEFPTPEWMSEDCKDLLARMICADPGERITVEGVLRHPWFRTGTGL